MVWPSTCLVTSSSMSISRLCGAALGHALQHPPHPAGALAARRALAAALVLVEIGRCARSPGSCRSTCPSRSRRRCRGRTQLAAGCRNPSAVSLICSAGTSAPTSRRGSRPSRLSQPPRTPPQCVSISSRNGMPIASSTLQGCSRGRRCRTAWCRCCWAGRCRRTTPRRGAGCPARPRSTRRC